MMRGENEGFLKLHIAPPGETAENILRGLFVKGQGRGVGTGGIGDTGWI